MKLEMYCWSRVPFGESNSTTINWSGDAFLTASPSRRTASGRRASATATRFCTSDCACSTLVPGLNTTLTVSLPSPTDCEDR